MGDVTLKSKIGGIIFIIIGILVFLFRYIPIYSQVGNKLYSLSYTHTACNSVLGGLFLDCNTPLIWDWVLIFGSIILVVIGILLIIKNWNK